jgi:hypothetical protein
MKKSTCEAWLVALRSGKYKQHRGSMNSDNAGRYSKAKAFCCLGVGAVVIAEINALQSIDNYIWDRRGENLLELGQLNIDDLVNMNDKKKKSFPEIADWIEANILPNCTEG